MDSDDALDSPWADSPDPHATSSAEWSKMSSQFIDAGYREGIVAGKESAIQEGFDSAFAEIGAPLGRELGLLRGVSSAVIAFITREGALPDHKLLADEARDIASKLANVRFSDIVPRDLEAEEHARQHLEQAGEEMDVNEEIAAKRDIENMEDMLASLTTSTSLNAKDLGRPTAADVHLLKDRLDALTRQLGIPINWS